MNFEGFTGKLAGFTPENIVFVALGNEYRGDDASGLLFLDKLRRVKQFRNSRFINAGTNPENYLDEILLHEPKAVIFIDSVHKSNSSGLIDWIEDAQMDSLQISTHAFSIRLIAEYLKKNMPLEVKFLGISAGPNNFGQKISQTTIDSIKEFFRTS